MSHLRGTGIIVVIIVATHHPRRQLLRLLKLGLITVGPPLHSELLELISRWVLLLSYARHLLLLRLLWMLGLRWIGIRVYELRNIARKIFANHHLMSVPTVWIVASSRHVTDLGSTGRRRLVTEHHLQFSMTWATAAILSLRGHLSCRLYVMACMVLRIVNWRFAASSFVRIIARIIGVVHDAFDQYMYLYTSQGMASVLWFTEHNYIQK